MRETNPVHTVMASYGGRRWIVFIEDFPHLTTRVRRRRHIARRATDVIAETTGRAEREVQVEVVIGHR